MKLHCLILLFFFFSSNCLAQEGAFKLPRTKTVAIRDSGTKRLYEIHIQLPRNYTQSKTYSVVYMTDSPYTFPIAVGAARFPINFKKMENVMFVGISWEVNYHGGLSRQRDYTPTASSPGFKDPSGQADKHLAFIQNDVITYIEKNYSVDPAKRTYMGNSFGGLLGAYILLNAPDTFKNYILGSPSFWWDNDYILTRGFKNNRLSPTVNAKVYIAVGADETKNSKSTSHDMVVGAKQFYSTLKAKKIKNLVLHLNVIDSANHETAFPTTAIQGLWWLFEI